MYNRDGLFHQQQALLRNNKSDINGIWQFTLVGWVWRKRITGSFRKSVSLIVIGILHFMAFGAAGVLSSHITTTGNQVLLSRSLKCGPWNETDNSLFWTLYLDSSTSSSQQYVQNCLSGTGQQSPECSLYKRMQLKWSSTSVPCPFDGMCLGPPNSSLHMDTGFIDSRDDLGINSRDEDRIQWRKNATCIPITTSGYMKNGTSSITYQSSTYIGQNAFNYTALFYGPNWNSPANIAAPLDPVLSNATYVNTNFYDIAMTIFTPTKDLWSTE
jgi:hypothetical protein